MRIELKATKEQRADVVMAAGCTVIFTSSPQLSATYALDQTTQDQIGAVARDAASGLGLPFGSDVFIYPDKDGGQHTFSSEQVISLYQAMRDYVAGILYYRAGQAAALPSQPVTIP